MKVENILFIDDDPIVNFIHKSLVEINYPHIKTQNFLWARDAIEHLSKQPPLSKTAVFLDINMPDIDGWETLQTLKNLSKNIDIYIITASLYDTDKIKANGFDMVKGYFIKPFKKNQLQEVIG